MKPFVKVFTDQSFTIGEVVGVYFDNMMFLFLSVF
jgi:hypothetical protein